MVKFKVKANPSGQYYFPKEVREEFGEKLELICNARAGVFYPEGTPLKIVLQSLKLVQRDLQHRLELEPAEKSGSQFRHASYSYGSQRHSLRRRRRR